MASLALDDPEDEPDEEEADDADELFELLEVPEEAGADAVPVEELEDEVGTAEASAETVFQVAAALALLSLSV